MNSSQVLNTRVGYFTTKTHIEDSNPPQVLKTRVGYTAALKHM